MYYVVPPPDIDATAISQVIGSQLSLRCDVTTVKGITSNLSIKWLTNGTEKEHNNVTENKTMYTLYYNGSGKLTSDDNNTVYQCQASINNVSRIYNLTLNVIGNGECDIPLLAR